MGHRVNPDREYRLLQQRLDRNMTGAPETPAFMKILKILFSPEDATFALKIPGSPTSVRKLSQKLNIPLNELNDKITDMARRGVVIDMFYENERYCLLPPVVIGFFEFTYMRTREDVPMKELSKLFDEYMNGDDRFCEAVFQKQTQLGRALVREEALLAEDYTEILDWERASHAVQTASTIGVSLCSCRHKSSHLGKACDRPQENCLSMNNSAEYLIRNGLAKPVSTKRAMEILELSKENGLMQTGDNVQRNVSYICNCCSCCCGMLQAIRRFDRRNAIVSSNWIMKVDLDQCNGCGKCTATCPVDAISMNKMVHHGKKRQKAVCDEGLCLGCGVCHASCQYNGISMKSRDQRVYTPETVFERIAMMAIERGKLADLIFENPEHLSYRFFGKVIHALEQSSPFKSAMAIESLRSVFLNMIVNGAKRKLGEMNTIL
ncbi:4Fe-4S binding protein [Deltaproteobacteria bacterium TL4]